MSSAANRKKKAILIKRLYSNFTKYKQIVIVNLLNVGSSQVQSIRGNLGKRNGELVIGKNTVIRKALNLRMNPLDEKMEDYQYFRQQGSEPLPQLQTLFNLAKGKIGLVFSDEPAFELKPLIETNKVKTAAKVGCMAPINVTIPPGPSGLDPSQISFFHALKVGTKIQKGQIEITKEFQVCEKGKPVENSQATLLQKLNIKPFEYGMEVLSVYDDGSVLTPDIVSLTPKDICQKFSIGVNNITALSLQLGIPTEFSVPHMIINAFKNLAGISLVSDYKISQLDNMVSSGPATTNQGENKVEEAPKEEVKVEEEQEEDMDMGDIFGEF